MKKTRNKNRSSSPTTAGTTGRCPAPRRGSPVCAYIYIYIYIYTHMQCVYMYAYMYRYMYVYMYTYIATAPSRWRSILYDQLLVYSIVFSYMYSIVLVIVIVYSISFSLVMVYSYQYTSLQYQFMSQYMMLCYVILQQIIYDVNQII